MWFLSKFGKNEKPSSISNGGFWRVKYANIFLFFRFSFSTRCTLRTFIPKTQFGLQILSFVPIFHTNCRILNTFTSPSVIDSNRPSREMTAHTIFFIFQSIENGYFIPHQFPVLFQNRLFGLLNQKLCFYPF